jgi:hypothetical protein
MAEDPNGYVNSVALSAALDVGNIPPMLPEQDMVLACVYGAKTMLESRIMDETDPNERIKLEKDLEDVKTLINAVNAGDSYAQSVIFAYIYGEFVSSHTALDNPAVRGAICILRILSQLGELINEQQIPTTRYGDGISEPEFNELEPEGR